MKQMDVLEIHALKTKKIFEIGQVYQVLRDGSHGDIKTPAIFKKKNEKFPKSWKAKKVF